MNTLKTLFVFAFTCILLNTSTTSMAAVTIHTSNVSPTAYCPGDSIMVPYTINGNFNVGNVFTAQLSNSAGSFSAAVNIGTLTSTSAGTIHGMIPNNATPGIHYRLRVYSSNPLDTGTISIDSITVKPTSFTTSISAFGPTTFCSTDSVTIWNVTGGIFTTYQWLRNGVAIVGADSPSYVARLGGIYTLVLGNGCGIDTSGSGVVVAVNQAPNMAVTGDTIVCINSGTTLTASGPNYNNYSWTPSNSLNQSNTSQVAASPTVTTTYTVTGTNINGCSATTTFTLQVSPLPAVIAYAAHDTICLGGSDSLTVTGAQIFSWFPTGSLNNDTATTVIAMPTSSTMYYVIGKNPACTPVSEDSVYVVVVPATGVSVTGIDSICNGASTTLTASGANSYIWTPSGSLNDNNTATVIASPTTTTLYYVTGINSGCNGLDSFQVNLKPSPNITVMGADTICVGNSTTLSASGGISYIWSPFIGLVDSVSASEVANPTTTVSYIITGLGTNGCNGIDTFTLNVSSCAGINEVTDNNSITIFPNPASENIVIDFNIHGESVSKISIVDTKGAMIYSQIISAAAGGNLPKTTIDLSSQAKGIYILQINTDKSSYRKKIVLE